MAEDQITVTQGESIQTDFIGYPIIQFENRHYIQVDNHHDARTLSDLYNSDVSKNTGYRASSIDVLPDHEGFYIRLDEIGKK